MSFDVPSLPVGWTYAALDTCCQSGSITYGIVQPGSPVSEGVPIVRVNNFRDMRLDLRDVMRVAPEVEAKYGRTRLKGGEVLLTIVGSVGQVAVAPADIAGFNVARAVAVIEPLPDVSADWIALCLRSPLSQHLLGSRANTTVQTTINLKDLRALPIPLPPAFERQMIAAHICALDDRITLLRETNATLEAIAQALFKSWFVDFDPVRAKMAGRAPEGMDETTAELFPDALEESELGVVPKGWQFGTVGDIARLKKGTVNPGSQPDAMFEHFSLPAFDDGCRPVFEQGEAIKSNKTPVPSDAVLLSKLNPHIPRVWLPVTCGSNAVCSTEFLVFQPMGVGSKELIYCTFSSPGFTLRLQQLVTGTSNSHQRIKPDQVALMSCVVPPKDIASQFEVSMRPIFERAHANREQAQTLASLRDALLPRLISGQLRLPEAQAQLEDALA
jgi:type I restriction enzyme S subunit